VPGLGMKRKPRTIEQLLSNVADKILAQHVDGMLEGQRMRKSVSKHEGKVRYAMSKDYRLVVITPDGAWTVP